MNTTADLKKKSIKFALGTTVAAVATPEMLYFSAGSANADPNVGFNDWPVGDLTVSIQDTLGVTADCTYYDLLCRIRIEPGIATPAPVLERVPSTGPRHRTLRHPGHPDRHDIERSRAMRRWPGHADHPHLLRSPCRSGTIGRRRPVRDAEALRPKCVRLCAWGEDDRHLFEPADKVRRRSIARNRPRCVTATYRRVNQSKRHQRRPHRRRLRRPINRRWLEHTPEPPYAPVRRLPAAGSNQM